MGFDDRGAHGRTGLGLLPVTALVVGHTIGVGIFLTPAEVVGGLASPVLTLGLWLGCAAMVVAGALTLGELASAYPRSGGLYIYLRAAWGERIAFLYGWQCLLVMDPGITAALAAGAAQYMGILCPAAEGSEPWIAIGLIWMLAGLAMTGLRLSARVAMVLTAGKALLLLGIVLGAFIAGDGSWTHFSPATARPPGATPLMGAAAAAFVGIFFSFGGFWEASRIAGEVSDASRTVPRALVAGVAAVTALYLGTTAAFIYLMPPSSVTSASVLAERIGQSLAGPAGTGLLAGAVLLSVVVSALALLIMAPALYTAMSRDGLFPRALAAPHPRTGAPVRAIVALALLASVFAAVATLQQIIALFMGTTLGFLALAAGGVVLLRRRKAPPPPFTVPGYPWPVAFFVVFVVTIMALVAISMPVQAASGLALVLLGVPAGAWRSRRRLAGRAAGSG